MSASIVSDKELSQLLKRLAAALENPQDADQDLNDLIDDADAAAEALDKRRGIVEVE